MPFIKLPGIEGWVYEPEKKSGSQKKHDCQDCFYCQMCSERRCVSCRKEKFGECTGTTKNRRKI